MSVKRRLPGQGQRLSPRGPGPRRGVARGLPVGVLVDELFFLWGKLFEVVTFVFPFPRISLYSSLFMLAPFFLG